MCAHSQLHFTAPKELAEIMMSKQHIQHFTGNRAQCVLGQHLDTEAALVENYKQTHIISKAEAKNVENSVK